MIPKQKHTSSRRYKVLRPATHDEWLEHRKKGIGASEAGIILGVNKYTTPYQLWCLKLGITPPVEENWAMQQGHIVEPYIAQLFEEEVGYQVIKASKGDWLAIDKERPYLRVSPDWTFWYGEKHNEQGKALLECKSSRNDYQPDCLQNECLSWFVQVQYQMYVMGYTAAYLGFLCVENGHHWFEYIEFNPEFVNKTLIPAIEKFWNENVAPGRIALETEGKDAAMEFAPENLTADDVPMRYPHQTEGKSIEITDDYAGRLSEYLQLRQQKKTIEEKMKAFEDDTRLIMADAESIVDAEGHPYVTYKQNKSSMKFDGKAFQAQHKDLYGQYLVETPGARVLKIK